MAFFHSSQHDSIVIGHPGHFFFKKKKIDIHNFFHHFNRTSRTRCVEAQRSQYVRTVWHSIGGYFQGFRNAPETDVKTACPRNVSIPSLRLIMVVIFCRQRVCKCCTSPSSNIVLSSTRLIFDFRARLIFHRFVHVHDVTACNTIFSHTLHSTTLLFGHVHSRKRLHRSNCFLIDFAS